MPRPALIIGVGGTGESVLAWLKKGLIETHGSLADVPVRLLLLDVVEPITNVGGLQSPSENNGSKEDPTDTYNARVSLSEFSSVGADEFLRLPDNGTGQAERNIIEAVRSDEAVREHKKTGSIQMPHFDWLRVNQFGAVVPNLYDGAGRFRQLGRLSLLQGLNKGGNDEVYARIRALIDQISRRSATRSLDVHIVGSFAGGTGSGLFLDVAWLVRKAAEDKTGDASGVFVTGFFAMPDVFSATPNRQLRYKAFCAWRELNRMQTIHPEELQNGFRQVWGNDESVIYDVKQPAYDQIYLVDANREGARLDNNKLIFPMMAEGINFFLDAAAGTEYIQRITRNLGPRKRSADYRGRPTFSTFFIKAWKLPTQHRELLYLHRIAARYLELLLGIEQMTFVDQATNTTVARYALTEQAMAGLRGSEILTGSLTKSGNTTFIEFLGRLHRGELAAHQREPEINNAAQLDAPLLSTYSQLPADEEGQRLATLIAEYTDFAVPEYNTEAKARDNLEAYYRMLHGVNGRSGRVEEIYGDFNTESVPGKLYEGLEIAHKHHLKLFQSRILEWTRVEMETAEAGKLAAVIRAMETLRDYLDDSLDFLREVIKRQPDVQKTADQARALHDEALGTTSNPGLFDKIVRRPKRSVTDWLEAESENLNARKNRRAAQRMINTLIAMRLYVQDVALAQLYHVKNILVGDNTTNTTIGLYRAVLNRMDQENRRYQADLAVAGAIVLLADNEPIPEPVNADVLPLVQQSGWTVDDDMGLSITVHIADQPPIELRTDTTNLDSLAERLVYQITAATKLDSVGRVSALQKLGVDRLTSELRSCQQTLFRSSNLTLRETRSFYVSAQGASADAKRKIEAGISALGLGGGGDSASAVVDSENPNKVVVLSTRELLLPEQFGEWDDSYREYNTQIVGDPNKKVPADPASVRGDHLFVAEQRAVELEARVRTLIQKDPDIFGKQADGSYRFNGRQLPVLNARLVHLLAAQDRLRDLLKAWILGWIGIDQNYWVLRIPNQRQVQLSSAMSGDMLSMFAAYVSDQTWVEASFNYQTVQARLAQQWQQDLSTNPQKLQDRCTLEQKFCSLVRVLHTELILLTPGQINAQNQAEAYLPLERPLLEADLEQKLRDLYNELKWDENAVADYQHQADIGRSSLAHQFCKDFTVLIGQDQPLINNLTAHEQAVEFVLYIMFGDLLTTEIKNNGGRR